MTDVAAIQLTSGSNVQANLYEVATYFDEIGKFDDEYKKPTYGFLSSKASSHLVRKEFDENGECPSELKVGI